MITGRKVKRLEFKDARRTSHQSHDTLYIVTINTEVLVKISKESNLCRWVNSLIYIQLRISNLWAWQPSGAGKGFLSVRHHVQTGSGSCLDTYPVGTVGASLSVSGRNENLTTHLYLMPKLRIHGVLLPFLHTS